MSKSLTSEQQDHVAEMMIAHLRLHNWKIEKDRPEPDGHSGIMG
jgi:hypothetical protein